MLMVFRLLTVFHMQITAYRHAGGDEGRLAFGGDDELAYFMNNDCDQQLISICISRNVSFVGLRKSTNH